MNHPPQPSASSVSAQAGVPRHVPCWLLLVLLGLSHHAALAQSGKLDTNFNIGTGVSGSYVHALAVGAEGKILAGGNFSSVQGVPRNNVAQLTSDGRLDTGFDPGLGPNNEVLAVAFHTDGKVLIGGLFSSVNRVPRNCVARLNANGSLDTGFDIGTGADSAVRVIRVQADGKILIGGQFVRFKGMPRSCIARLNTNGSLDTDFNPGKGVGGYLFVNGMAIQSDGKILIGGDFSTFNGTPRGSIARLNTDGSLDTTFDSGKGTTLDNPIMSIACQGDGKVLIAGSFKSYNGISRANIARLNSDGSLDPDFDPGKGISGGPYNIITSLALQGDGKILVGGGFDQVNGVPRSNLALINPDGRMDTNFTAKVDSPVRYVVVQNDGKALLGGQFIRVNGQASKYIARLDSPQPVPARFQACQLLNDGKMQLEFVCDPACRYLIQTSDDQVVWQTWTNVAPASGILRLTDADAATHSCRFYRALLQE